MSELSSIPPVGAGSMTPPNRISDQPARPAELNGHIGNGAVRPAASDRLELSEVSRYLDLLHRLPEHRTDRVEHVRLAIAAGAYETDEKIDVAIERLIEDLTR